MVELIEATPNDEFCVAPQRSVREFIDVTNLGGDLVRWMVWWMINGTDELWFSVNNALETKGFQVKDRVSVEVDGRQCPKKIRHKKKEELQKYETERRYWRDVAAVLLGRMGFAFQT
ncbi:hypothetical protein HELRODRAFT_178194 [Helobdella robusta]|uniref:Uncharacterized protein n=1 Tax=Helobdella robusta TaxID=6412 RepID=T1FCX2_HELRO|nr:hypothetical protein HELRODRAFT_178194 [Helobdella robusta]ESN97402.1 hypothetical protein HELRODRAFT_178194 [Helobdella robusta]